MILAWNSLYEVFPLVRLSDAESQLSALRDQVARLENELAELRLAFNVSEGTGHKLFGCAQDMTEKWQAATDEVARLERERDEALRSAHQSALNTNRIREASREALRAALTPSTPREAE
jgi:chromosome segregation ATPase